MTEARQLTARTLLAASGYSMEPNVMATSLRFLRDIPVGRFGVGPRAPMLLKWKAKLTNENLGWIIYESENTFTPVHRVLGDPEYGPVILVGACIYEIDVEHTDFYRTESEARAAYWAQRERRS